jgi:hypothetical protein
VRARLLLQGLEDRIAPATFTVTNADDVVDQNTGIAEAGSFRRAINDANAAAGADTIVFDSTFFASARTISLNFGQLNITDSVTITGTAPNLLTVSGTSSIGNGVFRVFNITGGTVSISGMTITGASVAGSNGAGIAMGGQNVSLNNVVITGNSTTGGSPGNGFSNGAGISVGTNGILSITNSTISGNNASAAGGGIYFGYNGSLTLVNSTISGNSADSQGSLATQGGGGIYFYGGVVAPGFTISNSTISGNTASNGGGIQFRALGGNVVIQNSTITNNTAVSTTTTAGLGGGGISKTSGAGTITLTSSVVAGNFAPNVGSATILPFRQDVSVAGSNTTNQNGRITATHSAIGADPGPLALSNTSANNLGFGLTTAQLGLGPLASNGGPVQTHALLASSMLINAGSNPASLPTDQRGGTFNRVTGPAADIGAFESTFTTPAATGTAADVTTAGGTTYTFTVTYVGTSILVSTLGNSDLTVTGPGGFTASPTFVSVDNNTNGSPRVATYSFTPPGGSWDVTKNGTYTVSLKSGEVTDTTPTPVPAGPVASFHVFVPLTAVVTNANDSGAGSLRQAILDSNNTSTLNNTIGFDPTFFATARTINLASELLITNPVIITGPGSGLLTLKPNTGVVSRIFDVNGTTATINASGVLNVTISNVTMTGGNQNGGVGGSTTSDGGAVFMADEALTFDTCVITGNTAGTGQGGAIAVGTSGFLRLLNTTVSGNTASVGGGVYFFNNGGLLVQNSTISGNTATGEGGGVYFYGVISGNGFIVRNSTISGNSAGSNGGGIFLRTSTGGANNANTTAATNTTIQNSTITNNTSGGATIGGGGIGQAVVFNNPTTAVPSNFRITSSIISGNVNNGPASDIAQATDPRANAPGLVVLLNSAVGSAAGFTAGTGSGSNLPFGTALNLGPLANNGGPTQTQALSAGSPAIDAGSNPANLTTDQRGGTFVRVSGTAADIGAYEFQGAAAPANVQSVGVNAGQANTVQRSSVTSLTVTFDKLVSFAGQASAAFQLARTGPTGTTGNVTLTVDLTGSTATQTIAKLTFSGSLTEGFTNAPSLVDGNYTLTVFSAQIQGGLNGGDNVSTLFRYYGDINGDRVVNGLDLAEFRAAFGTTTGQTGYSTYLDQNGDGAINGLDLAVYRTHFGTSLPSSP